jgi:hypothetical protein
MLIWRELGAPSPLPERILTLKFRADVQHFLASLEAHFHQAITAQHAVNTPPVDDRTGQLTMTRDGSSVADDLYFSGD